MRYIVAICMWLATLSGAVAADTKAEDIVAQHLDSIGTAAARAAVTSLAVQGTLHFKIILGRGRELRHLAAPIRGPQVEVCNEVRR